MRPLCLTVGQDIWERASQKCRRNCLLLSLLIGVSPSGPRRPLSEMTQRKAGSAKWLAYHTDCQHSNAGPLTSKIFLCDHVPCLSVYKGSA